MSDFDPDDLSGKMRTWKVAPQVPGSFQREVWQRIATRQAARQDALWPSMVQAVSALVTRPQYALALIVVSFSISIGVAHVQAQETRARHLKTLENRYAASVDPLAMAR